MRMGGMRRTTTIFDARATKEEGAQILNKTILHAKDVKHIFQQRRNCSSLFARMSLHDRLKRFLR